MAAASAICRGLAGGAILPAGGLLVGASSSPPAPETQESLPDAALSGARSRGRERRFHLVPTPSQGEDCEPAEGTADVGQPARFTFEPSEPRGWRQRAGGVVVAIEVVDLAERDRHPDLWRQVPYLPRGSEDEADLTWALCQPPVLRVTIANRSARPLRLAPSLANPDGVGALLRDPGGAVVGHAARRGELLDGKDDLVKVAAQLHGADPEQLARDLALADAQMAREISLLGQPSTLPAGQRASAYVCFQYVPWQAGGLAYGSWMADHPDLVLELTGLPVTESADAQFAFPIQVVAESSIADPAGSRRTADRASNQNR